MERGELEQKLLELKTLKDGGLLSEEQVARTTDELLKTFTLPRMPLPTTPAAGDGTSAAAAVGAGQPTPLPGADPLPTQPQGTDDGDGKLKWERVFCGDTREEAEAWLAATGLQYAWQCGGGKKGGHMKQCRSHKNCPNKVRISCRKQGWVVATKGQHSSEPREVTRGIRPKYLEDVDAGCRENMTPKKILQKLQQKFGMQDDLPPARQIDNRKRSLQVKERGGKKQRKGQDASGADEVTANETPEVADAAPEAAPTEAA